MKKLKLRKFENCRNKTLVVFVIFMFFQSSNPLTKAEVQKRPALKNELLKLSYFLKNFRIIKNEFNVELTYCVEIFQ